MISFFNWFVRSRWILSAKHCVEDENFDYYVGFGIDKVKIFDDGRFKVKRVVKNKDADLW